MPNKQVPILIGAVEFDTTQMGVEPIGRLAGIAPTTADGAIAVDELAERAYVVDPNGALRYSFGRSGDGPGEFRDPCCPRVSANEQVWILSPSVQRVDGFILGKDGVLSAERRVVRGAFSYLLRVPPVVLPSGRIAVTAVHSSGDYLSSQQVLVTLGADGAVVDERSLPRAPRDSLGVVVVRHPSGRSITRPIPFGPNYWIAFSKDGSYARAMTSRYDIVHYERGGRIRKRVVRSIAGAPVTAAERAEAQQELDELKRDVTRAGWSFPPVSVPSQKPPISALWFDDDGRLWVQLYASRTGVSQADVFSPDGARLFVAEWPADIALRDGAIRGRLAWGVRTGQLQEHHLVKLRFA